MINGRQAGARPMDIGEKKKKKRDKIYEGGNRRKSLLILKQNTKIRARAEGVSLCNTLTKPKKNNE